MLSKTSATFLGFAFGVTLGWGSAALADDLSWNGFGTVGLTGSNRSETYQTGASKAPTLVDETVLGLNLTKSMTPTTRIAAQLVATEENADAAVKADWFFISYHPVEAFELVVGKQKLPMWMVSSYLNVGVAYPWARPPEEVYSLFDLNAFTGASLRYDLKIGPSTLSFEPYGGETVIEAAPNAPTQDTEVTGKDLFGAELSWTWGKTTVRGSYNRARWDLDLGDTLQFGQRRFEIYSFGFSSKVANVTLMSEYAATRDLDQNKYLQISDQDAAAAKAAAAAGDTATASSLGAQAALLHYKVGGASAYYVTAGYQFPVTSLYLTYADLTKEPAADVSNDQRSVALGSDFDLTTDSVLKLEVKRVSLPGDSTGLFQVAPGANAGLSGAAFYTVNYNVVF